MVTVFIEARHSYIFFSKMSLKDSRYILSRNSLFSKVYKETRKYSKSMIKSNVQICFDIIIQRKQQILPFLCKFIKNFDAVEFEARNIFRTYLNFR